MILSESAVVFGFSGSLYAHCDPWNASRNSADSHSHYSSYSLREREEERNSSQPITLSKCCNHHWQSRRGLCGIKGAVSLNSYRRYLIIRVVLFGDGLRLVKIPSATPRRSISVASDRPSSQPRSRIVTRTNSTTCCFESVTQAVLQKMGLCSSRKKYVNDLSDEEVAAIREVWIRAKNDNVGRKILTTLIEKRPKFAEYFGIQSETFDMKTLNHSKEFQLQAHRIQNFLDTAVGSLGFCPISSVYDMAHRIGQIHFYRGVNFGADNWLVFKKVTVDQVTTGQTDSTTDILSNGNTEKKEEKTVLQGDDPLADLTNPYTGENCLARLGWNKLMTVIVREMKRGFLEEAMRNCKEEDNNGLLGA